MTARLLAIAAAVASFVFSWQAFGLAADGDPSLGVICLVLALLFTGVERALAEREQELGEWKTRCFNLHEARALDRLELRELRRLAEGARS